MKVRSAQIFFLIGCLIGCAALLSEMLLYSQNTLLRNNNWIAVKRKLAVATMGADEFLVTRSPLAGNVLNLGAWYGYQEVLLKEPRLFQEVNFKFAIPEDSYLDVIFDKADNGFSGLRLSRSAAYDTMFFSSDGEGKFTSAHPISLRELSPGWHTAALTFLGSGVSLAIDRHTPRLVKGIRGSGQLGFRAGWSGARIDDVVAADRDGNVFNESFRNSKSWLGLTALHFFLLLAVLGVISLFLLRLFHWQPPRIMQANLMVAANVVVCLTLFYAFDFFYWSKIPFQPEMHLLSTGRPVPQLLVETLRFGLFKAWGSVIFGGEDAHRAVELGYPAYRINKGPIFCASDRKKCTESSPEESHYHPGRGCFRFVLLGTSQSIGAGADSLEQTFFVRLHEGLKKKFGGRCLESLNLSISGSNAEELAGVFQGYAGFRPDLTVVDLSNNDDVEGFYGGLRRLATLAQRDSSRVVFIEEPNSLDGNRRSGLEDKHKIMRQLGRELGIETLSLGGLFREESIRQSGQIWWDYVHLTSYGQALVAERLLPGLLSVINGHGAKPGARTVSSADRR